MKLNFYRASFALVIMLCLIFTGISHAQNKKYVRPEDYALWKSAPKIISAETSEDGAWYAFKTGNDTLIQITIKNLRNALQYSFPAKTTSWLVDNYSYNPKTDFSKDGRWYAFTSSDTLHILELNTGKSQLFKNVNEFRFVEGGKYLLMSNNKTNGKEISLRNLKNGMTLSIGQVSQYEINAEENAVALILNENGLKQVKVIGIQPSFPVSLITSTNQNDFARLTWNQSGTAFAFYEAEKTDPKNFSKIFVCSDISIKPKLNSLDLYTKKIIPIGYRPRLQDRLHLSDDGKQVFFYFTKTETADKSARNGKYGIEVWHPNDLSLPAGSEIRWPDKQLWYQWRLKNETVMAITTKNHPCAVLASDAKKALIYNQKDYLPKYRYVHSFVDLYLKDLLTGNTKLLVKKIMYRHEASISPAGRYMAYFKEKNWWVYDIVQDHHRCLTEGFTTLLENNDQQSVGTLAAYGSAGWLKDSEELIIYDKNDIWLLSPDGKKKIKITSGDKINTVFRLDKPRPLYPSSPGPGEPYFLANIYDKKDGFLVTSLNTENLDNGLFLWTSKSGLQKIVTKSMELSSFGKAHPNKPLLFVESSFNVPPRLMLYKAPGNTSLIYESNPHQKDFKWGRSELVHFTTPDGKQLKGALFYPADYTPGKRYPMVVDIYERQAQHLHDYLIPSLSQDDAHSTVNVANFTLDGYFVFLPDFYYEHNDPGISATQSVITGVEKVIEMGLADRANIGLIGHSFGGYETAFIATQTDLFKTAIASAGITDISSWATLISQFGPNFDRVEAGQHRMTGKFLGEDYIRNSPMTYVHQMKTPILLWSGDKDTNVDVSQTISFHTALWRLGKQSTMIIYKNEGHSLMDPDNQIDITYRIKNWFDHYLKGEPKADWMVKGTEISK